MSESAGCSEVGQELEAEAHHEVPDVARHLRSGDEHSPDDHHQQRVERVADVSQSTTATAKATVLLFSFHACSCVLTAGQKKRDDSEWRFDNAAHTARNGKCGFACSLSLGELGFLSFQSAESSCQ